MLKDRRVAADELGLIQTFAVEATQSEQGGIGLDLFLPTVGINRFGWFKDEDETVWVSRAIEGLYKFEIEPADVDAAGERVRPEGADGPGFRISALK